MFGARREKLAFLREFMTVTRLDFILKTNSITLKTHENSLSKLWEKAKVGILGKTSLSFSLCREAIEK